MPVAAGGTIGMALRPRGGGRPAEARVGAAAAVLILGSDGVAAAAAAGVVLTVTGTLGGLCFAGWAGADRLWAVRRRTRLRRAAAMSSGELT